MTDHEPVWPHGLCTRCGLVWPCEPVVAALIDKHGLGLPFSAALWALFDAAAMAVPQAPALVLYEQCIRQPLRYARRRTEGTER